MKNNIFTIMRKELARVFKDRRMIFSIILPGLMIYLIYSVMGDAFTDMFATGEDYRYQIAVEELSPSVEAMMAEAPVDFIEEDLDSALKRLEQQELDLVVVFPEDFDTLAMEYNSLLYSAPAPNVEIYYNSASTTSGEAYANFTAVLDAFESMLANKFDVNRGDKTYDVATEEDTTGMLFSMMMPMLLMTFMFSGCMAVAPESIAGEKERGTIATLLVTPIKRSEIAIGKILSLSIIAVVSGISSFLGTMLSLPKLMGGTMEGVSAGVYSLADYLMLLVVIISTILVIVSLISIISAFASSVKEATGYISPLMIVVMIIGVSAMFGTGEIPVSCYFIPLYNSVQCISGIFSFAYSALHIALTALSNFAAAGIMAFILTKMFQSEKIMFKK